MTAVLDTNVIISGHLNAHGTPALVLDMVVGRMLSLAYDSRILAEYEEVLARPKFRIPPDRRHAFLALVKAFGTSVACEPWPHALPDPSDEAFLAVAKISNSVLVTGNERHYPANIRDGVKVLSVSVFLRDYAKIH